MRYNGIVSYSMFYCKKETLYEACNMFALGVPLVEGVCFYTPKGIGRNCIFCGVVRIEEIDDLRLKVKSCGYGVQFPGCL